MNDLRQRGFLPAAALLLSCAIGVPAATASRGAAGAEQAPAPAAVDGQCPADADGFRPLFNGKTFDGWQGDLKTFRIEDGAIVGGSLAAPIPRNEFLTTTEEFDDFELRLKFKLLGEKANAGIQIRSQRIPDHHEMIGYQADLGQTYWGCLYDESRRKKVLAGPKPEEQAKLIKAGQWNEYRIVCRGRQIQLWINGQATVDYAEPDETIPQKGLIGLQIHSGPPSEAWYKDIVIRKLPAGGR